MGWPPWLMMAKPGRLRFSVPGRESSRSERRFLEIRFAFAHPETRESVNRHVGLQGTSHTYNFRRAGRSLCLNAARSSAFKVEGVSELLTGSAPLFQPVHGEHLAVERGEHLRPLPGVSPDRHGECRRQSEDCRRGDVPKWPVEPKRSVTSRRAQRPRDEIPEGSPWRILVVKSRRLF